MRRYSGNRYDNNNFNSRDTRRYQNSDRSYNNRGYKRSFNDDSSFNGKRSGNSQYNDNNDSNNQSRNYTTRELNINIKDAGDRKESQAVKANNLVSDRNKRLFGSLFQRLQVSANEAKNDKLIEKQQIILKQVREREEKTTEILKESAHEAFKEHEQDFLETKWQKECDIKTKKVNALKEKTIALTESYSHFLKTQAKPSLYWLPSKRNEAIETLFKEQRKDIDNEIKELNINFATRLEEIKQIPIQRRETYLKRKQERDSKDISKIEENQSSKEINNNQSEDDKSVNESNDNHIQKEEENKEETVPSIETKEVDTKESQEDTNIDIKENDTLKEDKPMNEDDTNNVVYDE